MCSSDLDIQERLKLGELLRQLVGLVLVGCGTLILFGKIPPLHQDLTHHGVVEPQHAVLRLREGDLLLLDHLDDDPVPKAHVIVEDDLSDIVEKPSDVGLLGRDFSGDLSDVAGGVGQNTALHSSYWPPEYPDFSDSIRR